MTRAHGGASLLFQLYKAGRLEEALSKAEALVAAGTTALAVLRVRAYASAGLGRVPRAIAAYRDAIAASAAAPRRDEALHLELEFELGLELMKDGRAAEAAALVERTTSELPRLGLHPLLKTEAWRGVLPPPHLSPAAKQRLGLSDRALSLVRQVLAADDLRAFRAGFTDDLPGQYAISSNERRPLVHDVIDADAARILGFLLEKGLDLGATWTLSGQDWSAHSLAQAKGSARVLERLQGRSKPRRRASSRSP